MATRSFRAPELRFHRTRVGEGRLVVEHAWLKELGGRALMLAGGGLAAGMFLVPVVVLPAELWSIQALFALIGLPLAGLTVWATFLAQPHRADLELNPAGLEVRRGQRGHVGIHDLARIAGLVRVTLPGASDPRGPSPGSQRLGVHVAGVGTVGLARGSPEELDALVAEVRAILTDAGRQGLPVWPAAPERELVAALDRDPPPGVQVHEAIEGLHIDLEGPGATRRRLAYAVGTLPLGLAVGGLAAAVWLAPPASWHPFALLSDPDALVLGIVGAWMLAAVPATRRLVGRTHDLVGKGPYTLVLGDQELRVLGAGREVLATVAVETVVGFEVTRVGLRVLTEEGKIRLPAYALDRAERAWVAARLSLALEASPERGLAQEGAAVWPAGRSPT